MTLAKDIVDRIKRDFDDETFGRALSLLEASPWRGRVARCIVFLAKGSVQRLRELIEWTEIDERNVILKAEYENGTHCRDFSVSFVLDAPQKRWISNAVVTARKWGYGLSELTTNSPTGEMPDDLHAKADGEGVFVNGSNSILIRNQNGLWTLDAGDIDLRPFGLDAPIADEGRFLIQLDFFLSKS